MIHASKFGVGLGLILCTFLLGGNATLHAQGKGGGGGPPAMVDVLINFDRTPGPNEHAIVQGHGGEIRASYTIVPAVAARIPAPAVAALRANPNVTLIEEDSLVFTTESTTAVAEDLTELQNAWGVDRIGAGWVHRGYRIEEGVRLSLSSIPTTGTGISVAVIDTGIDYIHSELRFNYRGGHDYVNRDTDPYDDNGHGTHVAGTVAAAWDGTGVVGTAPDAFVYSLKFLGANGGGYTSDAISCVEWCIKHNEDVRAGMKPGHSLISVTNNSWGGAAENATLNGAFRNAYARGILHIGSAGNSGNLEGTGDNVGFPARYQQVMAVAATRPNDSRASFSSTGPDLEISAPGVFVRSVWPLWSPNHETGNPGYRLLSGTSMAAPHVSGVAALICNANPGLTPSGVRYILRQSALPLGVHEHYGYGLVDPIVAVMMADAVAVNPGFPISPTIQYAQLNNKKDLQVTVTIRRTPGGEPVPGALVDGEVLRQNSRTRFSGTADANGRFVITIARAQNGPYTTVLNAIGDARVIWPGGVWDGVTPANSFKH